LSQPAPKTAARAAAEEALLDAAERLLADVGYAGVTTRRLAEEAASTTALCTITSARTRTCSCTRWSGSPTGSSPASASCMPPICRSQTKWRTVMRYLVSEDVSYQKIWLVAAGAGLEQP